MGIAAGIGILSFVPFYYCVWNWPQPWVNLCGKGRNPAKVMAKVAYFLKLVQFFCLFSEASLHWPPFYVWPLFAFGQFLNVRVYQLLGVCGVYYGNRFGQHIPWISGFPFVIPHPQYTGSILSLLACFSWCPFRYILLWVIGFFVMMKVESKDDPSTRAKPLC